MIELAPIDIGQLETGLPELIKPEQASSAPAAVCRVPCAHVRLDAERTKASREPADVPLERGMAATTDIETCRRSTLPYLAKPVYKAFGAAVTEPCHAG